MIANMCEHWKGWWCSGIWEPYKPAYCLEVPPYTIITTHRSIRNQPNGNLKRWYLQKNYSFLYWTKRGGHLTLHTKICIKPKLKLTEDLASGSLEEYISNMDCQGPDEIMSQLMTDSSQRNAPQPMSLTMITTMPQLLQRKKVKKRYPDSNWWWKASQYFTKSRHRHTSRRG